MVSLTQHQIEWEWFKIQGKKRRAFNEKALRIINILMDIVSVVLIFSIINLLVLYFLDGR